MNNTTIKKIMVIGDLFPDFFADNIFVTLRQMGYIVKVLSSNPLMNTNRGYIRILASYMTRAVPQLESYFSKKLTININKFNPDLVIATNSGIAPQIIHKIKDETDSRVVCWFTDPISNMGRQYMLASPYDILFLKEPFMVDMFKNKLNRISYYLPEACNPLWHKKIKLSKSEKEYYECDIGLAGNMYYYRALILEQLADHQIKIWGPDFPRWLHSPSKRYFMGKYVAREEKAKAFRSAKINLNTLTPSEIHGVNCRTFEIAGCGGFQIVDAKPALSRLFDIDREIVTFETLEELKDKVAYYLAHDDERQAIALRSYERAHKEHTYEHRLRQLISVSEDIIEK